LPLIVSVPGLLPGTSVPPALMSTLPPIVPMPPSVPAAPTVSSPVAADWSPLIHSVPAFTSVAPA